MKLIYCTNKLINSINTFVQDKDKNHTNIGLGDWYSNIFTFNRRNCIVFVNMKTLCTFVVPDLLKRDLSKFNDYFIEGLTILLDRAEIKSEIKNVILKEYTDIQIVKTESKSILGSMNDYVQLYKWTLRKNEDTRKWTTEQYNAQVNKRPNAILEYRTPFELLDKVINQEYITVANSC